MSELQTTILQAMAVCAIFIVAFVAYGVSLRRAERRQRRDVKNVMWKKPGISPVKEYNYAEPSRIKVAGTNPSPNRAQRRLDKQSNSSHTVNWAD